MYLMLEWRYINSHLSFCGAVSWNALPYILKSKLTFSGFKEKIKQLILTEDKSDFYKIIS